MREDWIEVSFSEVLDIISGKNQKNVVSSNGKYPIYGSGGEIGRASSYLCREGTTIIGRKGTINNPIYVREKFWNVDTAFGLSPFSALNKRYLFFFARGFNFARLDKSTTIPSLSKRDLLQILIPLAPLPEQRAIVAKIEELLSELDKGEEDLKKAQEQLKIYRQAVLKKAFEGELTKEWRKSNNSYWFECVLGEILKVSSGKGLTAKKMSGSGYPVYGGNGVNGFHSEFLYERERLIIGRVGVRCGVTHVTQKQSWVTDNALVVTFINPEHFNLKFMKLKLQFENLNKLSSSTAQPVISGAKLYSYNIRIPEINEQIEIVQEIESRLSICESVEESIRESLNKSKALRQSILKKAFEGTLLSEKEIAACKVAPDYEPASILLERIKAEKKKN